MNARTLTYSDDRSVLVCEGSTKKSYSSPNDCLFMLCLEICMSELEPKEIRSFFSATYASSSRATPTLCPPWLKFLPSMIVDRVRVTPESMNANFQFFFSCSERKSFSSLPGLSFCWYPRPTWLELFILALTLESLSRAYLQPMPKLVALFDDVQPRFTAVSSSPLTRWYTLPPKT